VITAEEFNEFKKFTHMALNNLSAGMTRVQNAHDETLKELSEVKKELSVLKRFHHGHGAGPYETE
jgi:hypothetical protein